MTTMTVRTHGSRDLAECIESMIEDGFLIDDVQLVDGTEHDYDVSYYPKRVKVTGEKLVQYRLHVFMSNGTSGFYDLVEYWYVGSMKDAILQGNALLERLNPGYTAYAQMIFMI